jgi:hypothetical protein
MTLDRCPWYVAGPLLGLLIVGLRAAVNKPFGALGGYIDLAENAQAPARLGYKAYLLVGLMLGGASYTLMRAVGSGPWSAVAAGSSADLDTPGQLGVLLLAGVAMGFGARTAGGCTSGHGLSGMSLGSPASVVSGMTFFATAVAFAHLLAWFGGAR